MKQFAVGFSEFILCVILLIFFVLILCLISCVSSCLTTPETHRDNIGKLIEIKIPESEVLFYENTHGGFHGDGETGAVFSFTEENAEVISRNIAANEHWKALPMNELLEAMFYGRTHEGFGFGTLLSDYLQEVREGYWFFYNEQTKEYTIDFETICEASSFNYIIAVYDSADSKLYFYSLDT